MSENLGHEPWYAVRSVLFDPANKLFEERTVLFSAETSEEAFELAKAEAEDYCQSIGEMEYTGYSDHYHLSDAELGNGVEIFSLTRNSELSAQEYIKQFLDTGSENRS